jgi:hypothetical protein
MVFNDESIFTGRSKYRINPVSHWKGSICFKVMLWPTVAERGASGRAYILLRHPDNFPSLLLYLRH